MNRIGFDLGVLDDPQPAVHRGPAPCPGACLRVNLDEYDAYVRGGERFQTARREISANERTDARVMCSREVMTKKGCAGHLIEYGLCASCSGLEFRHREAMRALVGGGPR